MMIFLVRCVLDFAWLKNDSYYSSNAPINCWPHYPPPPPGALSGDGSGFDKVGNQMLHPLGRSGNQIPT